MYLFGQQCHQKRNPPALGNARHRWQQWRRRNVAGGGGGRPEPQLTGHGGLDNTDEVVTQLLVGKIACGRGDKKTKAVAPCRLCCCTPVESTRTAAAHPDVGALCGSIQHAKQPRRPGPLAGAPRACLGQAWQQERQTTKSGQRSNFSGQERRQWRAIMAQTPPTDRAAGTSPGSSGEQVAVARQTQTKLTCSGEPAALVAVHRLVGGRRDVRCRELVPRLPGGACSAPGPNRLRVIAPPHAARSHRAGQSAQHLLQLACLLS